MSGEDGPDASPISETLEQVYSEINKLEKSKIETREHSKREEVYMPLALAAVILLTIELLLRYLLMKNMS